MGAFECDQSTWKPIDEIVDVVVVDDDDAVGYFAVQGQMKRSGLHAPRKHYFLEWPPPYRNHLMRNFASC